MDPQSLGRVSNKIVSRFFTFIINFFLRELMQEPKELMQESWQGSGWASWGGSSCCGGKREERSRSPLHRVQADIVGPS